MTALEIRRRFKYVGAPRLARDTVTGMLSHRAQRAFACPDRFRLTAHIWFVFDQAEALKRGYFLERVTPRNDVRIVPTDACQHTDLDICNALEQAAFHGDEHAMKALAFIEQQDRFGWSGMWAIRDIEHKSSALRWWKDWEAARRLGITRVELSCRRLSESRREEYAAAEAKRTGATPADAQAIMLDKRERRLARKRRYADRATRSTSLTTDHA